MSVINTNAKEIHCKVVYYGPKNAGKKSAIKYIKSHFKEDKRNFWILPFKNEIYCLVLSLGNIFGFQTFFHVYNINNESVKDNALLLKGVDGLIFLASSKPKDRQKNIQSFLEMESFFKEDRRTLFKTPLVLQYNKRDLKEALPIRDLRLDLNKYNNRDFKSSVLKEELVLEPLKHLCKLVLNHLKRSDV